MKRRLPLLFALLKFVSGLLLAGYGTYELHRDEYLYLNYGQHLAWGQHRSTAPHGPAKLGNGAGRRLFLGESVAAALGQPYYLCSGAPGPAAGWRALGAGAGRRMLPHHGLRAAQSAVSAQGSFEVFSFTLGCYLLVRYVCKLPRKLNQPKAEVRWAPSPRKKPAILHLVSQLLLKQAAGASIPATLYSSFPIPCAAPAAARWRRQ